MVIRNEVQVAFREHLHVPFVVHDALVGELTPHTDVELRAVVAVFILDAFYEARVHARRFHRVERVALPAGLIFVVCVVEVPRVARSVPDEYRQDIP